MDVDGVGGGRARVDDALRMPLNQLFTHIGNDIPTLLSAILQLLPLDETAPPAMVMGMVRR